MATIQSTGNNNTVWQALQLELERATGRVAGVDFAARAIEASERLTLEIGRAEAALQASPILPSASETRGYLAGYLEALRLARSHIVEKSERNEIDVDRIIRSLWVKNLPHVARKEALEFVLINHGDLDLVRAKATNLDNDLYSPSKALAPAYAPGNSPGIYARSFLATLKEALHLISGS